MSNFTIFKAKKLIPFKYQYVFSVINFLIFYSADDELITKQHVLK